MSGSDYLNVFREQNILLERCHENIFWRGKISKGIFYFISSHFSFKFIICSHANHLVVFKSRCLSIFCLTFTIWTFWKSNFGMFCVWQTEVFALQMLKIFISPWGLWHLVKIVKSDCQTAIVSALDAQLFRRAAVSCSLVCGCGMDAPCASCCYLLHTGTLFKRLISHLHWRADPTSCNSSRRASLFSEYKNAPETLHFIVPRKRFCVGSCFNRCVKCQKLLLGPI